MTVGSKPLAIVAGAGPGLGCALMRRFGAAGYCTAGLVRSKPAGLADTPLLAVDLANAEAVQAAIGNLIRTYGAPKIVVHNPSRLVMGSLADTALEDFESTWRDMAYSAAILARAVLPHMTQAGGGAFLVSGATASVRGGARFAAFASAKFALRGLAQSLAREFQPMGVHVVHFILDGIIDTAASRARHSLDPSRMLSPDDIAEVYWQVAHQPRTAWSHESDLRPQPEKF